MLRPDHARTGNATALSIEGDSREQPAARRDFLAQGLLLGAALAAPGMPQALAASATVSRAASRRQARTSPIRIVCIIRYEIDPFQRDAFREYAENWGRIIPRCGGYLVGYFLPDQGTNYVAWGLIGFDSLAAYETYQARLRSDPEGRKNFAMAQTGRFILREERNFVEVVDGTFGIPAADARARSRAGQAPGG